ncbi:uncharacterized conserved protein, YTFE family, possibly metal-binding [Lachnospiraceae bacterium KM106-2]|nr:uncharacterized conserved protein, YTFE family, possibly metal-binding [Lachnospiraceae bacterium KM106-2]
MSAFLGPIHHWLYNKIQLENKMTNEVASLLGITEEVDTKFEHLDIRPLEEIIDESNIHGWLQEKVDLVERRFAFVLSKATVDGHLQQDVIECIKRFGGETAIELNINSLKDVYQIMNDLLLDGMPCDHVNSLESEEENKIVIRRNNCIHGKYYGEYNMDATAYYEARKAFMDGVLNFTPYAYIEIDSAYHLVRKDSVQIMVEEHDNILRMVKVIRHECKKLMNGEAPDMEKWAKLTDFVGNYADAHHHGKEEQLFFNVMEENLGPAGQKLIRNGMLVEHDMGRLYMHDLKEDLKELAAGTEERRLDAIANAISYCHLITRHIEKENTLVYPFGQKNLSEELMNQVNEDVYQFEEKAYTENTQNRFAEMIREMEKELY